MGLQEIQIIVVECIKNNFELSGEPLPPIIETTNLICDLEGFDSMRTLEVLVSIEEKIGCELPPDKIFSDSNPDGVTVSSISAEIFRLMSKAKQ